MPAKSHGRSYDAIYSVWQRMIARCYKPYSDSFENYGARGITVCDRWLNSFTDFLADMGERPEGTELDRKDNNGNYEPGNCQWSTKKQQARNKRSNVRITFNGRTQCIADWAEELGMKHETIRSRLARGWSAERALRPAEKKFRPQ